LRQILDRHVPKRLVERAKSGFGLPIGTWLRGPLRPWAEELLSRRRVAAEGFFNPDVIQKKWSEHVSGSRNCQDELWTILMFQAWLGARDVRAAAGVGSPLRDAEATLSCSAR
jgi:asparagine synthase (glutamine-hydrolysing)